MEVLKSKITAYVTEAQEDYEGSITICYELMELTGLKEFEKVEVNGFQNRINTYVLKGSKGQICLNGNAASKFNVNDKVHILAYEQMPEYSGADPKIIKCQLQDNKNVLI